MPEISLKEYFARLDSLLGASAADEVIHHSRHILQYYPKNVTAYRFLGRALVMSRRWDQGRETLRRVLSVIPDDFTAHLGLSEANEHIDHADEAIWHLERALEQRPNDKSLIDALRSLYQQHRNIHNLKIQLTSAAVARQYLRTGAYTQAIDALRNALARMNERIDLKLLLAQILWHQGSQEEAAELALEVLEVLPDCLEANKIMAQLWLSVNRPSDAQRYINRLEGVDPYLAVELAQGYAPDEDDFRIDELDYTRTSQSEMTSARPDWLQEISSSPAPPPVEVEEEAVEPDDSEVWASAMLKTRKPNAPEETPVDQPTSVRFAAISEQETQEEPADEELREVFGDLDEVDEDELSALFEAVPPGEDDPMAWLHDSEIHVADVADEEPSFESLLASEADEPLPEIDESPMSWLQAEDDLMPEARVRDPALQGSDDPFAWMRGDVEVDEPILEAQSDIVDEEDVESLDWLQDDTLLDEILDAEELTAEDQPEPQAGDWNFVASNTAVDDDDIPNDEALPKLPEEMPVPGPRRGLTAILQEANFDWMNKDDDDQIVSDNDLDDWLNEFGPPKPAQTATDNPDWLLELDRSKSAEFAAPIQPAWQVQPPADEPDLSEPDLSFESVAADQQPSEEDDSGVDWLREFVPQTESDVDADSISDDDISSDVDEAEVLEIPDWLSGVGSEQEADESEPQMNRDDESTWTTDDEFSSDADEAEAEAVEIPDWLSELAPTGEAEAPEPESAVDTGEAVWMSDADEVEAATVEIPDWLSELEPKQGEEPAETPAAAAAGVSPEVSLDEFPWMADAVDDEPEQPQGEAAAVPVEMPDWLAEMEPQAEASEPDAVAQDEVDVDEADDWMEDEAPEVEASQPADWLAALDLQHTARKPETPVASVSADEFPWMADETDELEEEAPHDMQSAAAVEIPDWLSELEPEQDEEEAAEEEPAAAVSPDEFPWMSDESEETGEAEEPEAEPAAADIPDWLSELEPEQDEEEAAEEEPAAAVSPDEFPWMSDEFEESDEAEEEPEAEPAAADIPDWLSELEPEQDEEEAAEEEPAAAVSPDEFPWMSDESEESDEAKKSRKPSRSQRTSPIGCWRRSRTKTRKNPL